MNLGKDIYDEEYKDYIKKKGITEDSLEDSENIEDYSSSKNREDCSYSENSEDYSCVKESKIYINCKLKVEFDTKNKIIYLYPGKCQYFTVDVLKSCGDVTIKYLGNCTENKICGNLGIYKIVKSGILVETFYKLDKRKKDILNFVAVDNCTGACHEFAVIFSCNQCCYC